MIDADRRASSTPLDRHQAGVPRAGRRRRRRSTGAAARRRRGRRGRGRARAGAHRRRARGGARASCTASGSSTARRRRSGRRCSTRARYLASERTMYRLLAAEHGGVRERRDQLTHPAYAAPELLAERPNEVWSWDITKLQGPGEVDVLLPLRDPRRLQPLRRRLDRPAPRERPQLAKALIAQAVEQQQIAPRPADRARRPRQLDDLQAGRVPARRPRRHQARHSRPYTSTDNPYSEAQFKTLKYRPAFPARFDSIEHARAFCREFFDWYNHAAPPLRDRPDDPRRPSTTAAPSTSTPTAPASSTPPTPRTPERFVRQRADDRPRSRPPRGSTSPTAEEAAH